MAVSAYAAQLRQVLQERPEDIAIDFNGTPFTWAEARAVAEGIEKILDDAGIPAGGKIGVLARNRPTHFSSLWGIYMAGRCISMVYAFQPPEALIGDLKKNRWPIVLAEPRDWTPEVIAAADEIGSVGYAFTGNADAPFERVTQNDKPASLTGADESDAVLQLLSSGTTGAPKRISLDRRAVDGMIERTIYQFGQGGDARKTVQIMPWPLGSLGGTNAALPIGVIGQTMATQERFDPAGILTMIRKYRPTFMSLPPAGLGMLLQLEPSKEDLSSIKVYSSGAAALDPNVHAKMEDHYGIPVGVAYGATEFAGIISGWINEDLHLIRAKRGSAGRALPGMKMRIVDQQTGAELPAGQSGLVEALVPRIGDDWVRTNDLAHMDEDGFLYLEGRADDAIIRGGFKIVPEEVAAVLRTHPKVGDAALIGIADERLGSVPVAVVEKRIDGEAPTAEELEAFLRDKLVPYKIPVRWAVVDAIPRTQSMKPRREGLRELFA
jgi:long-chain acyl-CoA synthetase